MAVEVIEDRAATLEFFPDRAAPASATAEFYSPGGSSLATPSVTVQSIGAAGVVTVSSVDTHTTLKVAILTGISARRPAWRAPAINSAASNFRPLSPPKTPPTAT